MSVSIPAGRINKLFGTDGGVMLSLYADFPADFDTDTPLLVTIDALEVPLWCERFERRGASGAVAAFADVDTERGGSNDNANTAAGDGTPPAGQFAGRVADYYDSEANPLFELEIGGRRVLVPAAEEFIAHIDFEGRTMKMILPEGLIDL